MPKPTLNISSLPGHAQLRAKAPALAAKLPTRLPSNLPTKLPTTDQLKAGAAELADRAMSVRRIVVGQVRNVATPLAHQAAARLAQVGTPTEQTQTTTKVSEVTVAPSDKAHTDKTRGDKTGGEKAPSDAKHDGPAAQDNGAAKPRTRPTSASTRQPKPKTAGK